MKKLFTIMMALCVITVSSFGQTNQTSVEYDTYLTDQNTTSFLKDVSSTETNPNFNTRDELTGNSLKNPIREKSPSNYIVKRGERPPINIMAAPEDAYEKGILKIKLDESFTNQLDNNPVNLGDNGAVIFNISAVDRLNKKYMPSGFKKLFESGAFTGEFTERHRAWGFHLWYTLYFDDKTDIKELVNAYGQLAEVSIAEPQYKTELHGNDKNKSDGNIEPTKEKATSNDTHFNRQWHYHNTGQYSGTVDADIDLPEAWDIETGNPNVLVSIHDMGVQYTHPDLNLNYSGLKYDFYNGNTTIEPGYHGTHVAGTIAAETNNSTGVAGVAGGWNSEGVNYMTAQVYLPTGGSGNGHHLAPVWAADNGACIEQNSWGYTSPGYYDQAVLDAIDYFNTNGGGTALSGGITIYSAGNHSAEGLYYPGCYSGTFAVAATDNHDVKAPYSTYGTWVDVSAPGGDNSVMDERAVYSTWTGSSYGYIDGTSMACPHVSGTAGLIISMAYGQLSPTDVADILRNTTDNIDALNPGYLGKVGTGRLNAYQALLETQNYMVTPGALMPIPAHSSSYNGNVRGYWFTAPTDFIVTGLRVPIDISGDQTIEIIRFNSGPPPVFSGTTNDFISLGRWVGVSGSGFITCNIPVSNGDHIGILGCRGTTTSYGTPNNYVTSINGNPVTLVRMGMQHPLTTYAAQDIWQEPSGSAIGRVEMYYESVPGIWAGTVNYSWDNPGNWSDGVVPNAGTNVTIPAGTPFDCWVASDDQFCNNLTIESGALLRIYDEILTVAGNMYIHGLLKMEEYIDIGELHIAGDIVWESGSTAQILSNSLNMFITGDWNFETGANVQLTQGYVTFEGDGNSWIRSFDSDCYFSKIRNEKTGIYGLAVSEFSTDDLYINGNIYNYSGNKIRFRSDHSVIISGFFNNMGGHFEGQFGTLVFDGWPGGTTLKPNTGDYLNNVTFSTSSIVQLDNSYSNLFTINGDLLIESGGIDANNFTIEIAGTWNNSVGTGGFLEETSTVRLINPTIGVQLIYSEHFNILKNDAVGGLRPASNSDVSCNVYYTSGGGISAAGSSFTAFDLAVGNITDNLYAHPGSEITLYQDAGEYIDLFSSVVWVKDNASINIIGGVDESYWCTSTDIELLIEGSGVLNFDGPGITIFNTNMLNETITDGSIKTSGWFTCNRADFNPAGGTFEFYGGTDSRINVLAGSTFHDLLINKSGGTKSNNEIKDRDGTTYKSSKSNTAILYSDVVVDNDLTVDNGLLDSNGHDMFVGGDWTNNVGATGFAEGTQTVTFNGTNDVGITQGETFYNLTLNKTSSGDWLTLSDDVTALGDLVINGGAIHTAANILDVSGDVNIDGGTLFVQAGGILKVGDNKTLTATSGSNFFIEGSASNYATLTHSGSGRFACNIYGQIAANYAVFEYMAGNGVYLHVGATVNPVYTFNHCIFQNGAPAKGSAYLVLHDASTFTSIDTYFDNAGGDVGNNVWKMVNSGNATFQAATGDFAGPEYEYDPNNRVQWTDIDVELGLEVLLEGPYNGVNMDIDLRTQGLIPTDQPFDSNSSADWYYTGSESVGSIPPNVVDWVLVQVRDASDAASAGSGTIVAEQAAFLLNNGSIVDLNGYSNLSFAGISYSSGLFPVVWHRNHLGVISADKMTRIGGVYTYDFTQADAAFGGINGQIEIDTGIWGMFGGDANGSGWIYDGDTYYNWNPFAGETGYRKADFNLDGQIDNKDKNDIWFDSYNMYSQIPGSKGNYSNDKK